ncbi:MAG: GNAT family N-acetyltransferase [Ktedonobacterales bacterium]|nr:GNAT family N-acetyltransferase [Ktedonobacterales bacterium]
MAQQAPIHYSIAEAQTLPLVRDILEESAQWLAQRGSPQWEPGSFTPAVVAAWQTDGVSLLAWQGARAIGTITVGYAADPLWAALAGDAGYIYKIAVRRAVAGTGVSLGLLRAAEAHIVARGKPLARLDCWLGNTALRAFYTASGYDLVGTITEETWACALFQRDLTPHSPGPSPE